MNDNQIICHLCKREDESHDHLFFKCEFSNKVVQHFERVLDFKMPVSDWNSCVTSLQARWKGRKGKSLMLRKCLSALVYFLWKERNSRFHRKVDLPANSVIKMIEKGISL